jgi:hypothetical protein
MPVWTILIATHCSREAKLRRLQAQLFPQVEAAAGAVAVEALWNHGERPVGQVRQDLLDSATGQYVNFIDDDDEIPAYYVERVLPLLDGVDYVGWRMQADIGGFLLAPTLHSLRFSGWSQDQAGYYRDISHLNPVRRELTEGTRFFGSWAEDYSWVVQLRGKLKTEHYIEDCMYYYRIRPAGSAQQQGQSMACNGALRPEVQHPYFSWHPASAT